MNNGTVQQVYDLPLAADVTVPSLAACSYHLNQVQEVTLSLRIVRSSVFPESETLIAMLPAGFRPQKNEYFSVFSAAFGTNNWAAGYGVVYTNGNIHVRIPGEQTSVVCGCTSYAQYQ